MHFARFLAGAPFRARKSGKCTSKGPPDARFGVHFPLNAAGGRALRLFPCTSSRCCKDSGEVHVIMQEKRRSARPAFEAHVVVQVGEVHVPAPEVRRFRENAHFPHFAAPEEFHARIWGKCATNCSDTGEMGGKPHAARTEKRSFPLYRCTRFPRCKDMWEMHEKRVRPAL